MLPTFLIMLREGLEAALIVGIIAGYLGRTGRAEWLPAVWVGVLLAVALSLFVGAGVLALGAQFPQKTQELFEALVGLLAVVVLLSMVLWMRKAAKSLSRTMEHDIDIALSHGRGATWALIGMTFFAVAREGLESVFFLLALFQQSPGPAAPLGALLGVAVAVMIGYGIYRGGVRINLGRFFRWTGVFIILVAAGLAASVLRNLHEAGLWNHLQQPIWDMTRTLPVQSVLGTVLSGLFGYHDAPVLGEVIVWALVLAGGLWLFLRPHAETPGQTVRRGPEMARKIQRTGGTPDHRQPLVAKSAAGQSGATPPSGRGLTFALAGAGMLVLLGVGAFWLAARSAVPDAAADEITVTVTDGTCDPADLTVPAGRRTFRIHNASDRALEWEILDGVMVVAERENIAPGLNATLTERLVPGTYAITCGLLSNPRGTLTVVRTEASEAARVQPETRAFIGPLSEYRVYLSRRASQLVEATAALKDRIAAGDLEGARSAWRAAREPWRQMAPVSARIADLANSMDPLAEYLAEREQDAAFTGFHRIEYGLWSQNTTEGLAPVADRLAADALILKDRLRNLDVAPADLAANSAAFAGRLADQAGAQTPYAGDDRAEFAAALDGIRKSALLVDPLVAAAQPEASATLHAALDGAEAAIGSYTPDAAGRERVAAAFRRVADAAGALNPAIGLE